MKPALSLLTLAILSSPALAATETKKELEVIEVTSNFRQVNLMHTQGSISVIANDEISKRMASHSEDLLAGMANVNYSSGASRGNFVQIRGIGLRSQFVDPINPSVGLIVDGINYSGLGGAAMLFDVESFSLYRGPQGTQFGNDALAGLIKLDSTAASSEQDSRFMMSIGDYNSRRLGLATGGAVSDTVNVRFSAVNQVSDGYINNEYLDRKDTNNIDESNIKFKINWQATELLTIDTTLHYIDIDNGYDAFSLDMNRISYSDQPGQDTQETKAVGVSAIYDGFEGAVLQINLSALDSDLSYSYDEDWAYGQYTWLSDDPTYTPDPCDTTQGPCLADADGYSSTDKYLRSRVQNTIDIRLLSKGKTLLDNKASWVAGVYVNQRNSDLTRQYTWLSQDFTSSNEHDDIALYGQISYDLYPKTTLTIGARIAQYDIDYLDNAGINQQVSDNLYGFNIGLKHQLNEQAMTFITFSRSDKAGGINGEALAKLSDINDEALKQQLLNNKSFDPETLYTAEFGVKGRSLNDDLNIKLSAFYNYRSNPQLKGWVTDKVDAKADTFVGYIDNAGGGRGYGLELETRYQLSDNIELYYNVGYLVTKIKDYVVHNKKIDDLNLHNRQMAHAPEYQFNAGINYQADNGFYASYELAGKDSFYFSDSHNEQSASYVLNNLTAGYQGDNWRLNLSAKNIFDKETQVRGFYFGNDPRDWYEAHNYVQLGAPSTVNLSLEMNW